MKFKPMDHMCPICKTLRNRGFHDSCSKKMQAKGNYKESIAPKLRSPKAIEDFVRRVSKL